MQATPLLATCRPSTGLPTSNPTIRSASRLRSPEREALRKAEFPCIRALGFFHYIAAKHLRNVLLREHSGVFDL